MSGHSKWATIKHKKGKADKARGKTFAKLSRQLEVAVREGGGPDPASNASLRTVVLKAKSAQMTNDAIDRAIKRGAGVQTGIRKHHLRGLCAGWGGASCRRSHRQSKPDSFRRASCLQ